MAITTHHENDRLYPPIKADNLMITTTDYNKKFLRQLATQTVLAGQHKRLIEAIGVTELVNHLSTIFWSPKGLLGLDVALVPGKPSPLAQTIMQVFGISQIIGFTPLYPITNPNCGDWKLVEKCEEMLIDSQLLYVSAKGKALDFPSADGCFLLIGASLEDAALVLSDQLSCIVLRQTGNAKLVSLVD